MTNSERASYIRGLMDGLELDPEAKETKVLNAMAELLDDLCFSIEELEDGVAEMADQVDEIDEDLGMLEEDYYGEEDGCDCCDEDFEGNLFEVTCPKCHNTIELNDEMLEEGFIMCPECGEKLEFDLEEDEDSCNCGCEHCKG